MRALLIGALALTLAGCSRQPPPQMTDASCVSPNPFACFMAVGLPMPNGISFRSNSTRAAPVHGRAAAQPHRAGKIMSAFRSKADTGAVKDEDASQRAQSLYSGQTANPRSAGPRID